jgi:mannose-6-phosphate isomerase
MGSHPRGRSELVAPDGTTRPIRDNSLPFLLKILAAEKGLSIQAHPSKIQAEEGYARENEANIPLDAPHRNYRDTNHKPELICALSDFWGLRGFRPISAIALELELLCDRSEYLRSALGLLLEELLERSDTDSWRRTFLQLLELGADRKGAGELVDAAAGLARDSGTGDPALGKVDRSDRYWWVLELQRQFPDDPGVLAPLYLNLIHLRPGEAAFLDARILHAYLYGGGIEIMANSDNVLRAGCTVKHVDITELGRVLTFEGDTPVPIRPEPGHAVSLYATPAAEFELMRVNVAVATRMELVRDRGEVIVLAVGTRAELTDDEGSVRIGPGESAFLDGTFGVDRRAGSGGTGFAGRHGAGAPARHRVRIEAEIPTRESGDGDTTVYGSYLFIASLPGAVKITVP